MRTTIYLDDDLNARLRELIPRRGLNRFINEAVADKIAVLDHQQLAQRMREGYIATRHERTELNQDWDIVDPEDWLSEHPAAG